MGFWQFGQCKLLWGRIFLGVTCPSHPSNLALPWQYPKPGVTLVRRFAACYFSRMSSFVLQLKRLVTLMCRVLGILIGRTARAWARVVAAHRGATTPLGFPKEHDIDLDGVTLRSRLLTLGSYQHRYTECGYSDAPPAKTIVMMGGVPTDASETFYWFVAALTRKDSGLRCIIIHPPYTEAYSVIETGSQKSRHNALALPFNLVVDLHKISIDTRFDHRNQAIVAYDIFSALGLKQAHFVGHDRGAVIFDYLISEHPDAALSYSRCAQLWDTYDTEWGDLAPSLIVGSPHRQMALPWQGRLLFFLVTVLQRPIQILSPGFIREGKRAKPGSCAYDRWTHLRYGLLTVTDDTLAKMRQTFMQTDSQDEVKAREPLKFTNVPIMQLQGKDEFAVNSSGVPVSDQPYFGRYNLFPNDVEDMYPGAVTQSRESRQEHLIESKDSYRLLKLKPSARFSRFALIPNAAHFLIVENPSACADALYAFVDS